MNSTPLEEKYKECRDCLSPIQKAICLDESKTFYQEILNTSTELKDSLKNIHADIKSIASRLSTLEVRLLILGPLKSGKSTFMRVLTKNPRVSSVSPLPAYPCVIEIRCMNDSNNEKIDKSEVYYEHQMPDLITTSEAEKKLAELLDKYINKEPIEREPKKVIQYAHYKTNTSTTLILIDSPGLLFGDPHYSQKTIDLIEDCDLAVFIIRPEQIFFQSVQEYLERLADKSDKIKVYILVNITTKGYTIEGSQLKKCDQSEYIEDMLKYFKGHIASDRLRTKISANNIIIVFDDLIASAEKRLREDSSFIDSQCDIANLRLNGISQIERYLTGKDLAEIKVRSIKEEIRELRHDSLKFLNAIANTLYDKKKHIENNLNQYREKQKSTVRKLKLLKGALDIISSKTAQARQISVQSEYIQDALSDDTDNIDEIRNIISQIEGINVYPNNVQDLINEHVGEIYDKWLDGGCGARTLSTLYKNIWHYKSHALSTTLKSYYTDKFAEYIKSISSEVKRLEAKLKDAYSNIPTIDCSDISKVEIPEQPKPSSIKIDPVLAFGWRWGTIEAETENEHSGLIRKIRKLYKKTRGCFIIDTNVLWGSNGDRLIESKSEIKLLKNQKKKILGQLLYDPTNLLLYFSNDRDINMNSNKIVDEVMRRLANNILIAANELSMEAREYEKCIRDEDRRNDECNNCLRDLSSRIGELDKISLD